MTKITLQLVPEELEENQANVAFIREASSQTGTDSSLFRIVPRQDKPLQAFIALSPEIALQ
jgi:hypothetical protein